MATGGEHGCEPVPEGSGEAREGGGGANGGVSEALQKVRYPLRNAEMNACIMLLYLWYCMERGLCAWTLLPGWLMLLTGTSYELDQLKLMAP